MTSRAQIRFWSASALGAGALHVVVGAAMILRVDSASAPALPPPAALVVELTELPPAAPPVPLNELPVGPESVEHAPREPPPRQEPEFEPPPEVETAVAPEVVVNTDSEPERESEEQSPATITAAPEAIQAPADQRVAARLAGAVSAAPSDAEQAWESLLLAHLERNKRYPGAAQRKRQEDVIHVRFVMDREGRVIEHTIQRSRGFPLLDREVTELLERSQPLPSPPAEVEGGKVEMIVPVEFFMRRR